MVLEDEQVTLMALKGTTQPPTGSLLRTVPLPRGTCSGGQPQQKVALGDLIGDLVVELNLMGAELVVALPAAACTLRVVEWPFDDWPEQPDLALRELNPDLGLPYPISEAYTTLVPLPSRDPSRPPTSLVAIAPRTLIQAWVEVFSIAALDLVCLEPAQVVTLRAMDQLIAASPPGELVVLLELHGDSAHLLLVRDGIPEFSRRITAGATSIERELRTCLAFWQRRDPSMMSVRVLVFGPAKACNQVSDTLSATPSWSVEIVDPSQQSWLNLVGIESDPDPYATDTAGGTALVRMAGLAAGDLSR
ncbi:type IV pilus biogenesis protein PilM [Synechococcus sp. ATX 2A4]|uniref:type IV pilus biogenesis protein PilM n=1 Tax=Synechococcus sp. ATX 2A4 TaxID=2823727 RepID=UPI0020CE7122|nr:hypothetical protein [Synechococcus sp. ATX 2A4]